MRFLILTIVLVAFHLCAAGFAQTEMDLNQQAPPKDAVKWMKGQPTAEELYIHQVINAQTNFLSYAVILYQKLTGKRPESLKQIYDAGYLYFVPFNYLQGRPMDLEGPSNPNPLPGDIWLEIEDGELYLFRQNDIWYAGRISKLGPITVNQDWRKGKSIEKYDFLRTFYSDPVNLKLYAMTEQLKWAITLHGVTEPNLLMAWPAWPFTHEGKNPITGGPLYKGTKPGEYSVDLVEKDGRRLLVVAVYGRDGRVIPNPHKIGTDPSTGEVKFTDWLNVVDMDEDYGSAKYREIDAKIKKAAEEALQK